MRTACFVDGYNLFYGLLSDTDKKWLDLKSLMTHLIDTKISPHTLVSVDYFTSSVKPALATLGETSLHAQNAYIRALKHSGVRVTMGQHRLEKGFAPVYLEGVKASRQNQCAIWQLEEKQTDVNLAISMYRTVAKQENAVQQIVLVSADTDMAPALAAIREDFPEIKIGVIFPHREGLQRNPPASLKEQADWTVGVITTKSLVEHQFRDKIQTGKKPIIKPEHWHTKQN